MPIFNLFPRNNDSTSVFVEHNTLNIFDGANTKTYALTMILEIDDNNPVNTIFDGQLKIDGIINNDNIVVVPAAKVELWARTKVREEGENPLIDLSNYRSYNTPCVELSLSDYIQGRNNFLDACLTNTGLTFTDWDNYIRELNNILEDLPLNSNKRKKAVATINSLLKETNLYDKVPTGFAIPQDARREWVQNNLSRELYFIGLQEIILPIVKKAYPLPEVQRQEWKNGQIITIPICDDYNGVCCLYDIEQQEIATLLFKDVKVYKKCLSNVDEATCLNHTKAFSQSANDATKGKFDGADFYNDNEKEYGCDLCKDPVSIVFCADNVPFIYKNLRVDEAENIIKNSYQTINLQYFNNPNKAQAEYNRRVLNNECRSTPDDEPLPSPPAVEFYDCIDDKLRILITPEACNDSVADYVSYQISIDGVFIPKNYPEVWINDNVAGNKVGLPTSKLLVELPYSHIDLINKKINAVVKYGKFVEGGSRQAGGPLVYGLESRPSNTLIVGPDLCPITPTPVVTPPAHS
jgi:hypothetical protein